MSRFAADPSIEATRCVAGRGGRRCQLLLGHDGTHAAMVSQRPFVWVRWDGDAVWSEWESYRFNDPRERVRWAITCPRMEPVTE